MIFSEVTSDGRYNYQGAHRRIPSQQCYRAWRQYLTDYTNLVDFLAFGWPVNFNSESPLLVALENHPSAVKYAGEVGFYVATELGHQALVRPYGGPPVSTFHVSLLMTHPEKDSNKQRVIMDLSWPLEASVNDGIREEWYLDRIASITLPTVEYMESRLLQLRRGAFLYKTDLSSGWIPTIGPSWVFSTEASTLSTSVPQLSCLRLHYSCSAHPRPSAGSTAGQVSWRRGAEKSFEETKADLEK